MQTSLVLIDLQILPPAAPFNEADRSSASDFRFWRSSAVMTAATRVRLLRNCGPRLRVGIAARAMSETTRHDHIPGALTLPMTAWPPS
jgi:hypothetical protein